MNFSMKTIITSFILGIILGVILAINICNNTTNTDTPVMYVFYGEKKVKNLSFERDSIYADKVDPYGVYNKKNGIIISPSDASKLAEIVLFPIYGEQSIIKQRPYEVTLINDSVWSINGTLRDGTEGGTFHMSIDKRDGRILNIWHDK